MGLKSKIRVRRTSHQEFPGYGCSSKNSAQQLLANASRSISLRDASHSGTNKKSKEFVYAREKRVGMRERKREREWGRPDEAFVRFPSSTGSMKNFHRDENEHIYLHAFVKTGISSRETLNKISMLYWIYI